MDVPYERREALSTRFMDWWGAIPEPTYDSSVRAPREWFWPVAVPVIVIVGQALQRAGVLP